MMGLLFLLGMAPALSGDLRDDQPLPRYLDDVRVTEVIRAALLSSAAPDGTLCGTVGTESLGGSLERTVEIRLRVSGSGQVLSVGPAELPGCWVEVIRRWTFPAHDEDAENLRVRLISSPTGAVVLLDAAVLPSDVGPLFLYLPPDPDSPTRAAIELLLGRGGASAGSTVPSE